MSPRRTVAVAGVWTPGRPVGEGLGFQAATFRDPQTRTVIAVLVNSSQPVNVATEIFEALAAQVESGAS